MKTIQDIKNPYIRKPIVALLAMVIFPFMVIVIAFTAIWDGIEEACHTVKGGAKEFQLMSWPIQDAWRGKR